MKIKKDQLTTIINEEIKTVLKENIISKLYSDVSDTYTRLNFARDEKPEKTKKAKISQQSYDEIIGEYVKTFQQKAKTDANMLKIYKETLEEAFSNFIDLQSGNLQETSLLQEQNNKSYEGDYYIVYSTIGQIFGKTVNAIYKKVEFELNRQLKYLIKNSFKGNLKAFRENLSNGFKAVIQAVSDKMKDNNFKKGFLNQKTYRQFMQLVPIIDSELGKEDNLKALEQIQNQLKIFFSYNESLDQDLLEKIGQKFSEVEEHIGIELELSTHRSRKTEQPPERYSALGMKIS